MICSTRVKFLGKNGHEKERLDAMEVLEIGKEYLVSEIIVEPFVTFIKLANHEAWPMKFNSVMFEGVEGSEI